MSTKYYLVNPYYKKIDIFTGIEKRKDQPWNDFTKVTLHNEYGECGVLKFLNDENGHRAFNDFIDHLQTGLAVTRVGLSFGRVGLRTYLEDKNTLLVSEYGEVTTYGELHRKADEVFMLE